MPMLIRCPVCGDTRNHPQSAYAIRGSGSEDATLPNHPRYPFRDDGLVIPFEGECGHAWEMIIGHHKGHATMQIVPRPDLRLEVNARHCV